MGDVTAGSDVTSVAGCHGGGDGGRGGCGGTGQPARATGAEVVDVVVDGAGGVGRNVGLVVGAVCAGGECVALATRSRCFAGAGGRPGHRGQCGNGRNDRGEQDGGGQPPRASDRGTRARVLYASYPCPRGAPGTGVVNANRGHAAQARETHRKATATTPNPIRVPRMPAAVVNHLHFREAPEPDLFVRAEQEVVPQARDIEGFREFHIVQVAPDHFILIITGDTPEVSTGRDRGWLVLDGRQRRAAPGVSTRATSRTNRRNIRPVSRKPRQPHCRRVVRHVE